MENIDTSTNSSILGYMDVWWILRKVRTTIITIDDFYLDSVKSICEEVYCINPAHLKKSPISSAFKKNSASKKTTKSVDDTCDMKGDNISNPKFKEISETNYKNYIQGINSDQNSMKLISFEKSKVSIHSNHTNDTQLPKEVIVID